MKLGCHRNQTGMPFKRYLPIPRVQLVGPHLKEKRAKKLKKKPVFLFIRALFSALRPNN